MPTTYFTIPDQHWRPHQINPVLIRSHPLARGLKFAEVFHEGKGSFVWDRVRPDIRGDVSFSTNSWAATDLGTAMEIDSSSTNNPTMWQSAGNYYSTLTEFTVEMIVRHDTTGQGGYYNISFGASPIDFDGGQGSHGGDPVWNMDLHWWFGGRTVWSAFGDSAVFIPVPTIGTWYQYIVVKTAGVSIAKLYINGADADSTISHISDQPATAAISGGIIRMFGGLFGSIPHRTAASLRIWDRPLTSTEVGDLFYDPWVIYEEADYVRRFAARAFAAPAAATIDLDLYGDPDYGGLEPTLSFVNGVTMDLFADPDAFFDMDVSAIQNVQLSGPFADPDAFYPMDVSVVIEAVGDVPSVDIGGSRDEVFVQVIVTGAPSYVIEGAEDDINFVAISPTLNYSTIWQLDPKLPYVRVRRVTGGSGSFVVYYGPQEGRVDGREKGVVSPRIRYSNQDQRKAH